MTEQDKINELLHVISSLVEQYMPENENGYDSKCMCAGQDAGNILAKYDLAEYDGRNIILKEGINNGHSK